MIKLSDLENDFINPHDATTSVNAFVVRPSADRLSCSRSFGAWEHLSFF